MKLQSKFLFPVFAILILLNACKKDFGPQPDVKDLPEPDKVLNQKERVAVLKFEHASLVLQGMFSAAPALRKEFNGFIAAKLAKSGTDEDLTFKEIFASKPVKLAGLKSDFMVRFKDAFVATIANGRYPQSAKYANLLLKTDADVAAYYDVKGGGFTDPSIMTPQGVDENEGVPYEIYFPYSENWNPAAEVSYAVSYHPLTNKEWNYGMFFDELGNPLYEVTIDDEYAFGTPTYIITYDDGLKLSDFANGKRPLEATNYRVSLTDEEYNPTDIEVYDVPIDPNPSPCTKELRVKDGRWTLLRNGYGIFEGKIDFGVAVTIKVTEVTVPNQNPQSNPIIFSDRSAHAWGYEKVRRRKIREMQRDEKSSVPIGLHVSPWCAEQPDKMLFIYEYDKPNIFSENALEWSNVLTAGLGMIGNESTRQTVASLASAGLAPLIKGLLEGTAKSRVENYSIIGSNSVWLNHRLPTNGMSPSLLNEFRPYGKNSTLVTLVID